MGIQWIDRGELWKSAILLQLRVRDRFHVAVDRRRDRPAMFSPDGYFSSTVHRWMDRFRDFRRNSLPSTSVLYRKRAVSKDLCAEEESAIFRMLQAVAVPLIGNACHVFMNGLNCVQVYGLEKLHDAVLNRPKDKPLVTVSNHIASVDDPLVIASLLPRRVLLDAQNLRWTLCASDRCFKNPLTSAFFRSVKVLPLSRGEGVYQQGMDMAISKLNNGGWVHIFPEGSRSKDGGRTMGSAKRGVGRLILDADSLPTVVPFVHVGMQEIMPIGANFPRIGKTVTVLVGDPIHFDDLLNSEGAKHVSRKKLYDAVASRIGQRLHQLKSQVDQLALEQSVKLRNLANESAGRAAEIMVQQADWDSFGMLTRYVEDSSSSGLEAYESEIMNVNGGLAGASEQQTSGVGLSVEGGIGWRIKRYMDSTELMGFAARGLFVENNKRVGSSSNVGSGRVGGFRAWREFLESSLTQQLNTC